MAGNRAVTLAALVAVVTVNAASAQAQGRLQLAGQSGLAIPTGGLKQLGEVGPTAGLELGYRMSDRWTLHAAGDFEHFEGRNLGVPLPENQGPGLDFWNYTAGVETRLWSPQGSRSLRVTLDGGRRRVAV